MISPFLLDRIAFMSVSHWGLVEARIMARQHSPDNPPGHADPRV
jgi:hypothetical protein